MGETPNSTATCTPFILFKIRNAVAKREKLELGDRRMLLRIGIYFGNVIDKGHEILGDGGNFAAPVIHCVADCLSSFLDEIGGPFSHHDRRSICICTRNGRHE